MAFTIPKTWAFQESVESSEFNTQIRDNFNAMGPHLIVRKTADESVTSSTTPQADNDLLVNIPANEIWLLEWKILIVAGTSGDWNGQWSFPSGGEFSGVAYSVESSVMTITRFETLTSPATGIQSDGAGGTVPHLVEVNVIYKNGGTAGNVTLEWAQNNSDGTATTVKANSTLWGVKLA